MLEDAGGGKAKRGSIERDDTRSVRVANIDPALTTTMHHNGQQQPLVSSTSFPHLASTSSSFLSFYFFVFFSFIDFLLSFLVSFPLVPLVNSLVSSAPLVRRRGIGRFASSPFVCRRDDVCRPLPPPLTPETDSLTDGRPCANLARALSTTYLLFSHLLFLPPLLSSILPLSTTNMRSRKGRSEWQTSRREAARMGTGTRTTPTHIRRTELMSCRTDGRKFSCPQAYMFRCKLWCSKYM